MSVEELVKEAHKAAQWDDSPSQILLELADKLEELATEVERLKEYSEVVTSKYKRLVHETGPAIIERAEKAEAALAEKDKEIAALREALFVADEAIMRSHGRFPLDRTTPDKVFLNDAAKLIRSYTDEDHSKRHLVVDEWVARNAGGKDV